MKRIPFVLLVVAALMAVFASSASAADQTAWQRLRTDVYTCHPAVVNGTLDQCATYTDPATDGGYARWQTFPRNGDDSPLDANARALVVHLPGVLTPTSTTDHDVAEVWTRASLHLDKPAANVKNLSFDAYKPALQGGSPRIDVFFQNPLSDGATYVAIDAGNCQQTLSSTWVRADATGQTTTGCTIYDSAGVAYSSGGGMSAWDAFNAANPGVYVSEVFMVFDEPTGNTGIDYRVDRISLGTNRMFTYSNTEAVSCNFSEAAC